MRYASRLLVILSLVCITSGCPKGRHAQEENSIRFDVVSVIDSIGHIATAGVAFIPPGVSPIASLPPDRLMNEGCDFKTSDSRLITEIISKLRLVEFRTSSHSPEWENRQVIYFRSDSGFEVRLVLGTASDGYRASIERLDTGNLQALTMDSSIEEEIYHWAAAIPQTPRANGMENVCRDAAR